MTNREWLGTLPLNELAEILTRKCHVCLGTSNNKLCRDYAKCTDGIVDWLEAEHKEELKPCPFCGGKAEIIEIEPMIQYVSCTQCIMQTNTGRKNEVIKAWNRRVDSE